MCDWVLAAHALVWFRVDLRRRVARIAREVDPRGGALRRRHGAAHEQPAQAGARRAAAGAAGAAVDRVLRQAHRGATRSAGASPLELSARASAGGA